MATGIAPSSIGTTVTGKMVSPNGSPIAGAIITAYLNDFGAEGNSLEVYPSDVLTTTTSDSSGLWSLTLWSTVGSVTATKYVFSIQTSPTTIPKEYTLEVPKQDTVLFSDLLAGYSARDVLNELLDSEPATYDMTIFRGVTFYREFLFQDGRNEPIDLTNYHAKLQMMDEYGSIVMTIDNIATTSDGYIQLQMSAADTSIAVIGDGTYDLLMSYQSKVYILLQGKISIQDTITKF